MQGKSLTPERPWIERNPTWGLTASGKDLELLQNVHRKDERPYLFIGGVHGDEPEGVRLAEEFCLWLKNHSTLDDHPWILIPCLNGDGYARRQRTNANGVDLNRNFPSRDWAPSTEKNRYYPGPRANSEPEVQKLVELIQSRNPKVIFHFHSWKPCIVYTGAPGRPFAEILTRGNPYEAREDIGYPTPGSLGQYGWLEHRIPVVCLEEQEHGDLDQVWPHFREGLQALIRNEGS
ncbi:MAG: DUF2817 domain-containing protein [Bdellovibrionales bacterium]